MHMAQERHVHIVALSSAERAEQARTCYALGFHAEIYGNHDELIAAHPHRGLVLAEDIARRGGVGALVAGMSAHGLWLPIIATSQDTDAHRVVEAVRCGVLDYLSLPLDQALLRAALETAVSEGHTRGSAQRQAVHARSRLATLTPRETEVLDLLVAGSSNKMIARELCISPRTVEIHRANMMGKLGAHHAADAVRLRLEAAMGTSAAAVPFTARAAGG